MKCPDSERYLHRLLDGTGSLDSPQWERHLAQCSPCRDDAHVAQAMLDALQKQRSPEPPSGLNRRIVQSVLADRPAPRQVRRPRHWLAAAALAACIVLLMLAQHQWLPTQSISVRMDTFAVKAEPSPSMETSVQMATTAVASLSGRLADKTKKHAQILWSLAPTLDLAAVDDFTPNNTHPAKSLEPAAASLRNGTSGVTHGVTVMARTTRRAFDYFLRDLPSLAPSTVNNN